MPSDWWTDEEISRLKGDWCLLGFITGALCGGLGVFLVATWPYITLR